MPENIQEPMEQNQSLYLSIHKKKALKFCLQIALQPVPFKTILRLMVKSKNARVTCSGTADLEWINEL